MSIACKESRPRVAEGEANAPVEPVDVSAGRETRRPGAFAHGVRVLRALARSLMTLAALAVAALGSLFIWDYYVSEPWTRDGRVRVEVASIAPQVSGQIVALRVVDNQYVRKGDVLYVIDPYDYRVALDAAEADVENRAADLQVKRAQAARRQALTTVSASVEEKQQFAGSAKVAQASYVSSEAQLRQARINLARTNVVSPVNGYVTNLLLRVGDYATKGVVNIAVVDAESYWIDGYFEETKMARIRLGAEAEAKLMGYRQPIRGHVESVARGIATSNAAASTQGLPNVDPVYTWVRLAQRTPVRIHIDAVPPGVPLIAGMTATVSVARPARLEGDAVERDFEKVARQFRSLIGGEDLPKSAAVTTLVEGAKTVSTLPSPEIGSPADDAKGPPLLPMNGEASSGGEASGQRQDAR